MTYRSTGSTGAASGLCEQMSALINALTRDEQNAALAQRIVEHLAECSACGNSEAGMAALLAQYGTDRLLPLPPEVEQRLLDRVCESFESGE